MANDTRNIEKQESSLPENVEHTRPGKLFSPPTDIYETDDAMLVVADMPDVRPESVEITLEKDVLTIHGHVEAEMPEGYSLAYAEYEVGDYQRAFSLSGEIDRDHIQARMEQGVLTLTLPKVKPTQRRIEVKTG